jgi:hypothetical protein
VAAPWVRLVQFRVNWTSSVAADTSSIRDPAEDVLHDERLLSAFDAKSKRRLRRSKGYKGLSIVLADPAGSVTLLRIARRKVKDASARSMYGRAGDDWVAERALLLSPKPKSAVLGQGMEF